MVSFISKPGHSSYTEAKSYHPISLKFFLLKTKERLIKSLTNYLLKSPLHHGQFAINLENELKMLSMKLCHSLRAIGYKEIALGTFIDIQGAFHSTSFEQITLQQTDMESVRQSFIRFVQC